MIALFLDPFVLMFCLWLASRGEAEAEYPTMFFVSLGISLASIFVGRGLEEELGPLGGSPVLLLSVFLLMEFCGSTLKQSALAIVLFGTWQFLRGMLLGMLLST